MALNAGASGSNFLYNRKYNKGTAFTSNERKNLGITGLLPPRIETIELQAVRCMQQLASFEKPINKYVFLLSLKDRNETLFYYLLLNNMEELLPIVYTPTVGEACQKFAHIWRISQGMYLSALEKGHFRNILDNWTDDVDIIVVTDGSRILGLGDLGTNGMGIPIGKLSLYVAGAGFHPSRTLPVVIDVGTNNQQLLSDPLYLGIQNQRLADKEYYELLDEFMAAVKDKWPSALVQFEDFSNDHCFDLLDRFRNKQLCFNDDIQGTGAVIAAGFLNAVKLSGIPMENHKFVFYGAGSAGVGVADCIVRMIEEHGMSASEARGKFYLVDTKGLVTVHRGDALQQHKIPYARHDVKEQLSNLLDIINFVKPTGLIGLAGSGRAFTPEILNALTKYSEKPIVFALSNPTSKSECSAEEAYINTNGKCIFASGSPFPNVNYNGKEYKPGQGNNMYIFPGLGFGAFLAKSKVVSDNMITVAVKTLADFVTPEDLSAGQIYPGVSKIREISVKIAASVMKKAIEEGHSQLESKPDNLEDFVRKHMYYPVYPEFA